MKVFIGADHGGYNLKNSLVQVLKEMNLECEDCGSLDYDQDDDYPAIAKRVILRKLIEPDSIAILICRSGQGMAICANRHKGIRASLVWQVELAKESREDNDANVLVLPADFLSFDQAKEIVSCFVTTSFSGEARHVRRIAQIEE